MARRLVSSICFLIFPAFSALASEGDLKSDSQAKAQSTEDSGFLPWILVDKKTNALKIMHSTDLKYAVVKTYRTTLGLVPGDKEREGDKKTPEGIYFFEEVLRPPAIAKKYGRMAITMNYPNAWDRFMKRTGSGIWLHATDEPQRMEKDLDSLGCVVVKDEEIEDIAASIRYRVSPIIVYEDFEAQKGLMSEERLASLKSRVEEWARSWAEKDLDRYMSFYHLNFSANGMNWNQWRNYKASLNKRYDQISVDINRLYVFAHPKYDVAIFNQVYTSRFKSGKVAHLSKGVKILYLAREGDTPKILSEEFRNTEI